MVKQTRGRSILHTASGFSLFFLASILISFVAVVVQQTTFSLEMVGYLSRNPQVVVRHVEGYTEEQVRGLPPDKLLQLTFEYPEVRNSLPAPLKAEGEKLLNTKALAIMEGIFAVIYLFRWKREEDKIHDLPDFDIGTRGWGLVVAALVCYQGANIGIALLLSSMNMLESNNMVFSNDQMLVTTVLTVVFAPIMEETFFRGIFFNRLRSIFTLQGALIGSAVLFGLMHGTEFNAITAGLMGLLLAVLYLRTGRIGSAITAHMVGNAIPALFVQVEQFMMRSVSPLELQHSNMQVAEQLRPYQFSFVCLILISVFLLMVPLRALHQMLPPLPPLRARMTPYAVPEDTGSGAELAKTVSDVL